MKYAIVAMALLAFAPAARADAKAEAQKAMSLASAKMPIKTKFVIREDLITADVKETPDEG